MVVVTTGTQKHVHMIYMQFQTNQQQQQQHTKYQRPVFLQAGWPSCRPTNSLEERVRAINK